VSPQIAGCLPAPAMLSKMAGTTAAATTTGAAATRTRDQFLVAKAQQWGVKVYQNFECVEVRVIFPCNGMPDTEDLETISPQGLLLTKEQLRRCALATFPFAQHVPICQARRYLSRDAGCLVLDDKGDGSAAFVQAEVVDLADGGIETAGNAYLMTVMTPTLPSKETWERTYHEQHGLSLMRFGSCASWLGKCLAKWRTNSRS